MVEESFLRLPAIMAITGLSRSTIYRLVAAGQFPPPIHPLGPRTSMWLGSEVEGWLRDRIAESRRGQGGADASRAA